MREGDGLLRELTLLINSRYGLIWIRTAEEDRYEALLRYLADSMNLPLFLWSLNTGLQRDDYDRPVYRSSDPKMAFDHILSAKYPAIYFFRGLGPFLDDRVLQSKLIDAARMNTKMEGAVVITGEDVTIPDPIRGHTAVVTPPPPDRKEFEKLLTDICNDLQTRMPVKVSLKRQEMNILLNNLQGLTLMEAEKILTKAIIEDGCLDANDIGRIIQEKKHVVEREGLLEFIPVDFGLTEIADLATLKSWLSKRKNIVFRPDEATSFGLVFPKGILLLGVPGGGKSLCAKAVASEWGLPLLKMDPSRLYNKYMGESEKNFRKAMETAERVSPVVLWIDEIEKAFAVAGEDGGVSQRVFGNFLSWMQERKGNVFIVATANNIDRLPPEFLRKGRFDEIFFVDLPDHETRREIFGIHLRKRDRDPEQFDLEGLADATEGFSGAEIEQVIVSALYTAFSGSNQLKTADLVKEAHRTRPLSKVRAEYIRGLRQWAKGRTVYAH